MVSEGKKGGNASRWGIGVVGEGGERPSVRGSEGKKKERFGRKMKRG